MTSAYAHLINVHAEASPTSFAASRARARVLSQLDAERIIEVARLLVLTRAEDAAAALVTDALVGALSTSTWDRHRAYEPGCVAFPVLAPLGINIDAPACHYRELYNELLPAISPILRDSGNLRGHLAHELGGVDLRTIAAAHAPEVLRGKPFATALAHIAASREATSAMLRERELAWLVGAVKLAYATSRDAPLSRRWERAAEVAGSRPRADTPLDAAATEAVLLRLRGARSEDDVVRALAAGIKANSPAS